MNRLPRAKGKQLVRALEKLGFQVARDRGSHVFLKHPDGRVTTVPVHSGGVIGPGLLRAILKDAELSAEDLVKLINRQAVAIFPILAIFRLAPFSPPE
jgi:predicted RNA binding protein YcfA (HicA-like mRNA interferase family)